MRCHHGLLLCVKAGERVRHYYRLRTMAFIIS